MKKTLLLLSIGFTVVGCQSVSDQFATKGICQPNTTQTLVGKQDLTVDEIAKITKASQVRMVKPGQAVTMDYRAERVTVMIDNAQTIIRAGCG